MIKDYGLQKYSYVNRTLPRKEEGEWVLTCQLPHNAQFQPWIEVESEPGQVIEMHSTNFLVKCMQPVQSRTTVAGVHHYEVENWISGQGAYYRIPANVEVRAVKYRETGFDTDFVGIFTCNDEDYNVLWQKAARTCYLCMRDHFMDCPDRERTPTCLGDVALQIEQVFYTFDTRAHELAKEAILKNRDYTHIVDQNLVFAGEGSTWFYYMNTADVETMKAQYPHMKKYLENWTLDDDGLNTHKGVPHHGDPDGWDWCDWGSESKDRRIVQCTQYYAAMGVLKKMARVTGHTGDIAAIDQHLNSIRENFDRHFWTGAYYQSGSATGTSDAPHRQAISGQSQEPDLPENVTQLHYPDERANAMAVVTGLAGKDKWDSIFTNVLSQKLNPEWEGGNTYNADTYFERWIMEALCIMGREEFALLRMYDRYKEQINSSFTTLYEGFGRWWKGQFNAYATVNHGWNTPNTILSKYIAGIAPVEPGWDVFQVKPREAFLQSVETVVPTIKGEVRVEIDKTQDCYRLHLNVPPGTQAIAGIPRKAFTRLDAIECAGKLIWKAGRKDTPGGMTSAEDDDDHICFRVDPGEWVFEAKGIVSTSTPKPAAQKNPKRICLDRKLFTVTASHTHTGPMISYGNWKPAAKSGGSAFDAVDGDFFTFWSTGRPQRGDEWLIIDMGAAHAITSIELENSWCPYDYPRQYRVLLSDDGINWTTSVAAGKGSPSITRIDLGKVTALQKSDPQALRFSRSEKNEPSSFVTPCSTFNIPKFQMGRYVKLEQLGTHEKYWWSISDIRIYAGNTL